MAGFFKNIRVGLILVGCALINPEAAVARCRSGIPQATLLESIPLEAERSEVVARVLILSIGKDPDNEPFPFEINYALAFVIEAIKGVKKTN